ncbi:site-2 protease family protein [Microseira wollei]|uniref:Zinc metalloprotease n=1 Tax=Microseira wollei NIES-4236 TaxID=2530354 RepID=A0AAV3XIK2_9CYAN|nr:site-2 protease family protein [Microseira wollei]GET41421.1 peptidase M50 [Microseira wollei NIES-4236]
MQAGWRIGSIFGIPLNIDPSWLIILGFFTFANGLDLVSENPEWGFLAWVTGFLIALLLFVSVLLHELGHSLVARSQGIKVNSITLFLFGGIAAIDRESQTPGQAFQVAIAGPLVSLTLFALLSILFFQIPQSSPAGVVVGNLAQINLVLGLFNLIPGLPLDGGQILKAAVWKITGDRFSGVHWAARAGQILGWLAIISGLFFAFTTEEFGFFWIALLGWFVLRNATAYDTMTNLQETLLQLTAADAMTREFRVIDAHMTLRQFADDYLLEAKEAQVYFAASDGRYRGLVSAEDLRSVERSLWETQTVHTIAKPLDQIDTVEEKSSLVDAINKLETKQLRRITVLSPAGAVAGIIDRGDIVKAIATALKFSIPEAQIKRIKQEGSYPGGFPIPAIAKATAEAQQQQTPSELTSASK